MASAKDTEIQQLEQRLDSNADSLIFSRLADSYRKQGDIQKAINISVGGLERHPWYVTGHIILGRCYLEQQNHQEAIQEFTQVCRLDRRNLIALKMLADIYSKQGMEDKAGDLYSLLLKMDPENASLVNLARNYKSSGKSDIFKIIGIEQSSRADSGDTAETAAPAGEPSTQNAEQPPQPAEQPVSEAGPQASMQPFPPEDVVSDDEVEHLRPAPQEPVVDIEETVEDISADDGENITGSDIANRMDMMFNENGEAIAEEIEEAGGEPVVEESVDGPQIEPLPDQPPDTPSLTDTAISDSLSNIPSSDDIASRVEAMFGEESDVAGGEETAAAPETPNTEPAAPEMKIEDMAPSQDVQGEDISSRIEEMFEEEPAAIQEEATVPQTHEPIETEQGFSDDSVEGALSQGTAQETSEASDDDRETLVKENKAHETSDEQGGINGDDVSSRMDDIFEDKEAAPETAEMVTSPSETDMSGENVTSGIDEMFEDETAVTTETEEQNLSETAAVDLSDTSTVETGKDTAPQQEENQNVQTDISGDDVTSRINEMFEEKTAGEDASENALSETTTVDLPESSRQTGETEQDEVSPETQSPDTDISGEDVTSRIEEMFGEEDAGAAAVQETAQPEEHVAADETPADDTGADKLDTGEQEIDTSELEKTVALEQPGPAPDMEPTPAENAIDKAITTENYIPDSIEEARTVAIDRSAIDEAISDKMQRETQESLPTEEIDIGKKSDAVTGDDVSSRVDELFTDEENTGVDDATAEIQHHEPATDESPVAARDEEPEDFSTIGASLENTIDEATVDLPADIAGEDVGQRLDEMFPDDTLTSETPDADIVPDDDDSGEEVSGGFYTIAGENAGDTATDTEGLDNVHRLDVDNSISEYDLPQ
ncbi:MAG: hypothetical protein GF350_10575, partial [Chitinivibrionales bacterium]|nr:hypothetical protein [Chitinivibrionales bacterium]